MWGGSCCISGVSASSEGFGKLFSSKYLSSLIVLVSISLASVTMRLVVMFGCDDCLNSDSEERGKEGLGAAQVDEEPPRTQACVSC